VATTVGCEAAPSQAPRLSAQQPIPIETFAGLVARISEPGGFFDTDNLISNEAGYLNVMDALASLSLEGGAYLGVGPDQNFSYIAQIRPSIAFIIDVRRDNLLHHLLLKALIERSPTRVEFLSALHGVDPPPDPARWRDRSAEALVAYVDSARGARPDPAPARLTALRASLVEAIAGYGIPLAGVDAETIARFHSAFVDAGPGLRFTSFGRPARPHYPTYRQLVLETDIDGDRVSYLASAERYAVVRALQRANRIVPVVGDLSGTSALVEIGRVMREMGVELSAMYASNVEFYLWRDGSIERWLDNVRSLPATHDAVLIRSYFSNFGRGHPSAVRGYYATQILQPVTSLREGGFESYWDLVTRDVLPLR